MGTDAEADQRGYGEGGDGGMGDFGWDEDECEKDGKGYEEGGGGEIGEG